LGSGGSADGRQRRSSTYPQAFVVNLARRVVAEALVLALFVIEIHTKRLDNVHPVAEAPLAVVRGIG